MFTNITYTLSTLATLAILLASIAAIATLAQPRPRGTFPWLWRYPPPKPGKSALGTRLALASFGTRTTFALLAALPPFAKQVCLLHLESHFVLWAQKTCGLVGIF